MPVRNPDGVLDIDVAVGRHRKVWGIDPSRAATIRAVCGITDGDWKGESGYAAEKWAVSNGKIVSLTAAENGESQQYTTGGHDEVVD